MRCLKRSFFIIIILLAAHSAYAFETYEGRTSGYEVNETAEDGKVILTWSGEIANNSANASTLSATIVLYDAKNEIVAKFESPSVNVERFKKIKHKATFEIRKSDWEKVDSIDSSAQLSKKTPINGKRILEIELFSVDWCPHCKKAKAFLDKLGYSYMEYDVEHDEEANKRMRKLNPQGSIPVAVIEGTVIIGFSEAAYKKALGLEK